jgi:nicotinate-nucleotide adenylyltransferase
LLGGSFNPAHEGHRHVALLAMRRLRLDQVWLLVSPGNPLKSGNGMAPLEDRMASAARIAGSRRIRPTGIEARYGTRFTIDTLAELRRRFPRAQFVWIMGADILVQLPRWLQWMDIARTMSFVVLPRPGYTHQALAGQASHRLGRWRRPARQACLLPGNAPGWVFLPERQNPASATAIREAAKGTVP